MEEYKIIPFTSTPPTSLPENEWDYDFCVEETRFAIADQHGKIIDDAQGYGYKTKQKAYKALSWKFKGGKGKTQKAKSEFEKWKAERAENAKIIEKFYDWLEWDVKAIARGETTEEQIWKSLEEEYGVKVPDSIKKQALK